jgi:hypothetical protein
MCYVKIHDTGTQAVNTSISIQDEGLRIPPVKCHCPSLHDGIRHRLAGNNVPLFERSWATGRSRRQASPSISTPHEDLATKQGQPHEVVTPRTFSSIIHLGIRNTSEQARRPWKPLTDLLCSGPLWPCNLLLM